MTAITIYDDETGEILRTCDVPESMVQYQADPIGGEAIYRGHVLNAHRKRIDVETGEPVDFTPPRPTPQHTWDETNGRWLSRADRNAPIVTAIERLEAQQPRAVREAVLTGNKAALQQIETQIEVLRNTLERD